MKCRWCNKILSQDEIENKIEYTEEFDNFKFCSEDCKGKFLDFNRYVKKNQYKFILVFFLGIILGSVVLPIISYKLQIEGVSYLIWMWDGYIFGLTLIIFPFCTPSTNSTLGVKSAIKLGRSIGALFFFSAIIATIIFIIKFI